MSTDKKTKSSGAEKAEKLERRSNQSDGNSESTKNTKNAQREVTNKKGAKSANGSGRKPSRKGADGARSPKAKAASAKTEKRAEKAKSEKPAKAKRSEKALKRKEARAQKKLRAAEIRAERKQRKLEKKLEAKQRRLDRIAASRQARAERKEARRERKDMLKHETKEARLERRLAEKEAKIEARNAKREAAAAERQAKREHRLKLRAEKRAEKHDKRHAPGFGGWLAAVISLGVVTLALGTMLTFGWMYTDRMQADMTSMQTENLYELNSIFDNLDANLSKARVANTRAEQVRLLSDIAVESEMAETVLERFPVDMSLTQSMTSFVNKMGDSAQSMLYNVANGKKLTESQLATLNYMYETNAKLKETLNELTSSASGSDLLDMLRGKSDGLMYLTFGDIENTPVETPKEIHDGPFAENVKEISPKSLKGLEEITAAKAEELAQKYFAEYGVTGVSCTGEAVNGKIELYNVTVSTDDGDMWAQISKAGGKVVEFNSYKDCNDKNYSPERCAEIASEFLENIGYTGMKAVWTSENGTVCNLNFAYEEDGVVCYPDMIKVKVCEERGIVTGLEGVGYVLNHTQRELPAASLSKKEARAGLNGEFEVKTSRLTLIPTDGGERLAYEFYGNYGESEYYIYVDAQTGDEIEMFTVIGTAQGRALM